nr:ABC transporter permease [uncultured Roseateles sp.]
MSGRADLQRARLWWLASLAVALGLVAGWALVAQQQWVSRVFLPAPAEAWEALLDGLRNGELGARTLGTLERMVYGWLIASVAGVALGALIGLSSGARTWLLPGLELLRPLPATALLPVGIALLGLTPGMLLAVVAFGAAWPVLLATAHGFSSIEPRLGEVARMLGLGRRAFIWKFVLPHALPDILSGMRLSLTASLIVAVVGEMVTAQEGLGTTIMYASRSFRSAELYAGVILLGVIGYVGNLLLQLAERRLLKWQHSSG